MSIDNSLFTNPTVLAMIAYPVATWLARRILPRYLGISINPITIAVIIGAGMYITGMYLPEQEKAAVIDLLNVVIGILAALGVSVGVQAAATKRDKRVLPNTTLAGKALEHDKHLWESWL